MVPVHIFARRHTYNLVNFVGAAITYVDLSLFQLIEGLRYAFSRATENLPKTYPARMAMNASIKRRKPIADYVSSPRRLPFNQSGILRHYPELDQDP